MRPVQPWGYPTLPPDGVSSPGVAMLYCQSPRPGSVAVGLIDVFPCTHPVCDGPPAPVTPVIVGASGSSTSSTTPPVYASSQLGRVRCVSTKRPNHASLPCAIVP